MALFFDTAPLTSNPLTHGKQFQRARLDYQASLSTPTVHVCAGLVSGGGFLVTLRLEDGMAPVISLVCTAGLTGPAVSAAYIGSLGGLFGAVWVCDDTDSGWTQTEHSNTGGRFFELTKMEGVYLLDDTGAGFNLFRATVPIPASWCCPNGNNDINGDGACEPADTLPGTCDVTITGFTDATDKPRSELNGTFTLTKASETSNATYVTASYTMTTTITGLDLQFDAVITAPRPGVDSAQCAAAVKITVVAGVIAAGTVWYGLPSGGDPSIFWAWMPLGCQFGYGGINASSASAISPDTLYGRPTLLAW